VGNNGNVTDTLHVNVACEKVCKGTVYLQMIYIYRNQYYLDRGEGVDEYRQCARKIIWKVVLCLTIILTFF
jgi:hypothetical protein